MEKIASIEVHITGSSGNIAITPDNYDIREVIGVLENVEQMLFPQEKSIDFLDLPTAKAIEHFQEIAAKKDYVFAIKTSFLSRKANFSSGKEVSFLTIRSCSPRQMQSSRSNITFPSDTESLKIYDM